MGRIVVVSDIHGSISAWRKAENFFKDADLVLSAGDVLYHGARNPLTEGYNTEGLVDEINKSDYNLLMVKGNVDALVDDWVLPYPLPEYALVDRKGTRIVIYHGYQHRTAEERIEFACRFGADILIFGHTHIPHLERKKGVILLNPGSLAMPKQDPPEPSLAVIEEGVIKIKTLAGSKVITGIDLI